MNHILDHIGLYIEEDGQTHLYKRIFSDNQIPNYYPPIDKRKTYIDEVLFLPIELEDFNKDRIHKFYGYRYMFTSSGSTVSFGPDPIKMGVTKFQLTVEVSRIRYYINDDSHIVIDRKCDSLYPPYIVTLEGKSANIGESAQLVITSLINRYNEFYIDRRV